MYFHPDESQSYRKFLPDLETIIREGKLGAWIKERLLFNEYDPYSQLTMEPDIIRFDHSYNDGASSPTAPINYFITNGYAQKIFEEAAVLMEEIATQPDLGNHHFYLDRFGDVFFPKFFPDYDWTNKKERKVYEAFYEKNIPRWSTILLDLLLSQGVPSERTSPRFGEYEEKVVQLYLDTQCLQRIPEEKRLEAVRWFRDYVAERQYWINGFRALQQLVELYVNPVDSHEAKSTLPFFD